MALGQQKRWAAIKGTIESPSQAATPEPSKPKRNLSAAGRAAIVAATKARWDRIRVEAAKAKPAAKKSAAKAMIGFRRLIPRAVLVLIAAIAFFPAFLDGNVHRPTIQSFPLWAL
jgi:hypothetical protein